MSAPGTALITGASSGIGRATATALAARGHRLLLGFSAGGDRIGSVARDLTLRFGVDCVPVRIDLRDPDAALDTCLAAVEAAGDVSCLVNNAGINDRTPAAELPLDRMREVFAVNAFAPIALASAVGARMIGAGVRGSIVNVTSIHESVPITGGALYCAGKAALGMATKVLALEFAAHGIRVNAVAPGETATAMNGVTDETRYHAIARPAIPLGRPGSVGEIAGLIAFLTGPEASYITGVTVTADGGLGLTAAEANARWAGYGSEPSTERRIG
ncbi:SDR family oxidoreductase [Nocardia seriolae]|uniref:3-oxoacyl-[acyl-carrier-protein] reductase MabA n=1 Tax=Nocardia seriolae TaxID=37332 RepID=A0A0B8N800_9NOCA|nr:SDR family oxidoreductase [Nocardia seriolae]APA99977.1 3-oxoacyl-[acyl-carrier-protein] reductase [Nocardia seriolae]MTJ64659.1 SDR family oxidoreductase [Nocardia seriolae]MTJ73030.1 SDR family oxidoreductase [Nocardia seriolae]MTJ89502.1 SDR family oxidoreductase [Nocardia seriolae]MTK33477.1 SDR family oxidoreductase [Nocardia seriolae]